MGNHSPSKVMAGVGKNIMLGLGKGMQAQIPGVLGIASALAGSISGAMSGVVGPSVQAGAGRSIPGVAAGAQSLTPPSGFGSETINLTLDLGEGIVQRLKLERDSQTRQFRVAARTA
jgi:hypothetical protein